MCNKVGILATGNVAQTERLLGLVDKIDNVYI